MVVGLVVQLPRCRRLAGDAVILAGPLAQVDQAAAFAAEWTPALFGAPLHRTPAARTLYLDKSFVGHEAFDLVEYERFCQAGFKERTCSAGTEYSPQRVAGVPPRLVAESGW